MTEKNATDQAKPIQRKPSPINGQVDGAVYTPDELLITGEAGKE